MHAYPVSTVRMFRALNAYMRLPIQPSSQLAVDPDEPQREQQEDELRKQDEQRADKVSFKGFCVDRRCYHLWLRGFTISCNKKGTTGGGEKGKESTKKRRQVETKGGGTQGEREGEVRCVCVLLH